MKINDYIEDIYFLNQQNCMQLFKFEKKMKDISSKNYTYLVYSEELIEHNDLNDVLNKLTNTIVLLLNVDIDFPPPKKPYSYDKYFKNYRLPPDHEKINYYDKINTEFIPIIEKNNIHIFTYSLSLQHKNLFFLPLGVSKNFNYFYLKQNKKDILCYLNFGIPCDRWFGNPRKYIVEELKQKTFITNKNGLSNDEFFNDISKSKFAICPRGCGIDTYRLWDCIALGCIPIVEKYDSHEQFSDLPILFLNKEDYIDLNETFLNEKYEEYLKLEFNYEKCTLKYWENKIFNYTI